MAGKKDEFDFDDFDFEEFGDGGEGDFDGSDKSAKRSPVENFAGGFVDGVKDSFLSAQTQRTFIKAALPSGYGQALDAADVVTTSVRDLYDTAMKEAAPVIEDTKKLLSMVVPSNSKYVPEGLKKKLDAWAAQSGTASSVSKVDAEELTITNELGQIFKMQAEEQAKKDITQMGRDGIRDLLMAKQGASTISALDAIRSFMSRQVGFQDQVTAQYQRKSLELQFRSYFVQRKLLDTMQQYSAMSKVAFGEIVKNTGLPDAVKINASEHLRHLMKERFFGMIGQNMQGWFRGIGGRLVAKAKGDIRDFFQSMGGTIQDVMMGIETTRDMAEMMPGGRAALGGSMAGQMAGQWIADKAAGPLRKWMEKQKGVMAGSHYLNRIFSDVPGAVNRWSSDWTASVIPERFQNNPLAQILMRGEDWLKEGVGQYKREDTIQKSMVDNLDDAVHFNLQTRKTITEVIPGWLSRIHQELAIIRTGDDSVEPLHYSFDSASFETTAASASRLHRKLFDPYAMKRTQESSQNFLKSVGGAGDRNLSPEAAEALRKLMLKQAQDQSNMFDPRAMVDEYRLNELGVKGRNASELAEYFKTHFQFDEFEGDNGKFAFTEENQYNMLRAQRAFEELKKTMPDIHGTILKEAQAGGLRNVQALGLSRMDGTTHRVDYDKFYEMFNDPTTVAGQTGLPGGTGPGGMRRGPLLVPGAAPAAMPIPGSAGQPGTALHVTGEAADKLSTTIEDMKTALVDAIMETNAREIQIQSYDKLCELVDFMKDCGCWGGGNGGGNGEKKPGMAGRLGRGALAAGKHLWRRVADGAMQDVNRVRNLFGKAGSLLKGGVNFASGVIGEMGFQLSDIYVKGETDPVLLAKDIRAGKYLDKKTGKVIKRLKDITGPVASVETGNIVVSQEDFEKGLTDSNGRRILQKVTATLLKGGFALGRNVIGRIFGRGANALTLLKDAGVGLWRTANALEDIYVKGEDNPRLLARHMRAGVYFLKRGGKPVRSVGDISGTVVNEDGEVVLTEDDIKKGLVDKNGKPIRSLLQKGGDLLGAGLRMAGRGLRAAKGAIDAGINKVTDMAKAGWGWLTGNGDKGGKGTGGLFSFFGRSSPIVDRLDKIYAVLDQRLPGKKGSFTDTDGDGDREGSAADQRQKRAGKEKKDTLFDKLKGLFGRGEKKDKPKEDDEGGGLLSGLGGLLSSFGLGFVGKMIGGAAKLLGKTGIGSLVGTLIGGAVSGLGKLAGGAMGLAGKAMGGLAGLAVRGVGAVAGAAAPMLGTIAGGLATGLGALASGAAAILTSPVTLAVGAVALAGYGAYKLYQYATAPKNYLTKFRMVQYGVDYEEEKLVNIIGQMEAKVIKVTKVAKGQDASIGSGITVEEMMNLFGLDPSDEDQVNRWLTWFQYRFKPVFLSHMTILSDMTGGKELEKIDDNLDTDQRLEYIKRVHFGTGSDSPYNIAATPFPDDDLEYGPGDVQDEYEDFVEEIEDERGETEADKKKAEKSGDKKDPKDDSSTWFGGAWANVKQKAADVIASGWAKVGALAAAARGIGGNIAEGAKVAAGAIGGATAQGYAQGGVTGAFSGFVQGYKSVVTGNAKNNRDAMIREMIAQGIKDPKEQAMLLAQVDHESGGFSRLEENLKYSSAERLMAISTSARNKGLAAVQAAVKSGAMAVAEVMYGGRMGNDQPGDGFKYRGRGFIQLTGKENYAAASKALGIDLINNPDQASDPAIAAKIAIWYWKTRVGSVGATGDVTAVTKRINGGTIGLGDRQQLYAGYLKDAQSGQLQASASEVKPGTAPTVENKPGATVVAAAATPPKPGTPAAAPAAAAAAAAAAAPAAIKPTAPPTLAGPSAATALPAPASQPAAPMPAMAAAAAPGGFGLMPASYSTDKAMMDQQQQQKSMAAQVQATQAFAAQQTSQGIDGVVSILAETYKVNVSMDAKLGQAVELLSFIKDAATKTAGQPAVPTAVPQGGQRLAAATPSQRATPRTAVSMAHNSYASLGVRG